MNSQLRLTLLLLSLAMLLVSLWQFEIIMISMENSWVYGLPFGYGTSNLWFAHDIWFSLIFVSWLMLAFIVVKT